MEAIQSAQLDAGVFVVNADQARFAVIGAGLSGAATAWQLAARGHEVALLERATPGHRGGSSHGSARIFRYAYPESLYARLVIEAKALWDELERLGGAELIATTGALDFGDQRHPERLADVLAGLGVEHELLGIERAAERWPHFAFDTPVLWHPGAGVIDADRAVETMVSLAVDQGARLCTDWTLRSVDRTRTGYRLTSSHGDELLAEQVVVCAGGWLPEMLSDLSLPTGFLAGMPSLEVRQEQAYHFPYRVERSVADEEFDTEQWPTFIYKSQQIQTYGLPGGSDADHRGQKVAEFNGGKRLSSASMQDQVVDPMNRRRVVAYVERHLPGLVAESYAETTCLFTNTPDEHFVLDRAEGITVVSPCSGHGAKFAPLIGAMTADLASGAGSTEQAARVPAEFRVTRA
jgi:sarcosine oxidase